eukprot:2897399-Rhodomonas_salina.6
MQVSAVFVLPGGRAFTARTPHAGSEVPSPDPDERLDAVSELTCPTWTISAKNLPSTPHLNIQNMSSTLTGIHPPTHHRPLACPRRLCPSPPVLVILKPTAKEARCSHCC